MKLKIGKQCEKKKNEPQSWFFKKYEYIENTPVMLNAIEVFEAVWTRPKPIYRQGFSDFKEISRS